MAKKKVTPVVTDETTQDASVTEETTEEPPVTEETTEEPPVKTKVAKEAVTREPHHVGFFSQYVSMLRSNRPVQAIKALSNCYKTMLASKDAKSFDAILTMFRDEKLFLSHNMLLKSAAVLPANERAIAEIVTTIFHMLVNSPNAPINLEYARTVIKNEEFIVWVAKILAK